MPEDKNKSLRDMLFRTILSATSMANSVNDEDEGDDDDPNRSKRSISQRLDIGAAKELIASVAGWAGKGKDELVQMLFREIGQAVAAMLKEPLTQVIENRKLQITLEFAPRNKESSAKAKAKTKRKTSHLKRTRRPNQ